MPEIYQPLFSIITPTCGRPLLLQRTINSIINQTFKNYEHIIVDDANDKQTESLVNGFGDKRIIFHQHPNPRGAAGSYNSGIRISRGKFILFLDDDDEYLPAFLEKMFHHFSQSGPNVGFVWTGISRIIDTDSGEKFLNSKVWPSRFPTKELGLVEATSIGNGFGVCVRKECIDIIGFYDESIIMGQDADFLFRLAKNFDFETIPEVLVKIHQHGSSQLTDEKNNFVRLELREKILKRHLDLLNKFPKLYYVHYKYIVDLCYDLKLRQKGRKTMLSIIRNTPFRILYLIDLIFYELSGKNTLMSYNGSRLKKFVDFLKRKLLKSKYKMVLF
jgi:glycosyltransferase involved in cell wall biosynthesis